MEMERILEGLQALRERLDRAEFDPDPERPGWPDRAGLLAELRAQIESLLGARRAIEAVPEPAQREAVGAAIAGACGEIAAIHIAAGDRSAALSLLERAADMSPAGSDQRKVLLEASGNLDGFRDLSRARWLLRLGRVREADAAYDDVLEGRAGQMPGPAITAAARAELAGPRPISSVPTLFRWNGCGVGLYGSRSPQEDGSHVKTTCISLAWVPLIPLQAFRVHDAGDGWIFVGRERLSRFARAARVAVLSLMVLAIAGFGLYLYLGSTSRQLRLALDDARSLEESGDTEAALRRYDEIIAEYQGRVADARLRPAAAGIVRITSDLVPQPFTAASIDGAYRLVTRYQSLPAPLRQGEAADLVVADLITWANQLGDGDLASAGGSVRLLDWAVDIAGEDRTLHERRDAARLALAGRLAGDRPLQALRELDALGSSPEAVAAAGAILDRFPDGGSLWLEAAPEVDRWLAQAGGDRTMTARAERARGNLERVRQRAADPARTAVLEGTDLAALTGAFAEHPADQELAVALAQARAAGGDPAGALAVITGLGKPGWLTGAAQLALAELQAQTGDLTAADATLTALIAERLPAFQEGGRRYEEAASKAEQELVDLANTRMPADLERLLQGVAPDGHQAVFTRWAAEKIDADPAVQRVIDAMQRDSIAVAASISLGMIKLQRADGVAPDQRKPLLEQAEQVFLAIRSGAEGQPAFHLGMGQVYHRLGRKAEGDAELQALVDRDDPDLTLAVARTYRELGIELRARELAESVHAAADEPHKSRAAIVRSLLAIDLADEETWLRKADQSDPHVRRNLLGVEAGRLLEQGKRREADAAFARVADEWDREARRDPSATNNAAIALQERFACTGDLVQLREAVRRLERARQMAPDDAVIVSNLAHTLSHLGLARVLGKFLDLPVLAPDAPDSATLLDLLLDGPDRQAVEAALRAEPALRRSVEVVRQEQMLAPQAAQGYRLELQVSRLLGDDPAILRLLERLRRIDIDPDPDMVRWLDGEDDGRYLRNMLRNLTTAERVVADARRRGEPRTLAGALVLEAQAHGALTVLEDPAERAALAVSRLREAASLLPTPGVRRRLAGALIALAFGRAMAQVPALAATWQRDRRTVPIPLQIHRLLGAAGDSGRAALLGRGELADARPLLAGPGPDPDLHDWIYARLLGDTAVEAALKAALATPAAQHRAEIQNRLVPDHPAFRMRHKLILELARR